jgi:hypothetical protein
MKFLNISVEAAEPGFHNTSIILEVFENKKL